MWHRCTLEWDKAVRISCYQTTAYIFCNCCNSWNENQSIYRKRMIMHKKKNVKVHIFSPCRLYMYILLPWGLLTCSILAILYIYLLEILMQKSRSSMHPCQKIPTTYIKECTTTNDRLSNRNLNQFPLLWLQLYRRHYDRCDVCRLQRIREVEG